MSRKAIFITGAAAGIGRATAQRFAAAGWFVGLYDLATEALATLQTELGTANAVSGRLDVADSAAVIAALEAFTRASGGRLDVMFACAGIVTTGAFESIPVARHHQIVDVNLKGVINCAHAALPHLRRTRGARLISMASASAIYGPPAFASYAATKFAVRGLSEALSIEWARDRIRVMDLMPLFVATPMVASIAAPPKSVARLGVRLSADDVARTVWQAAHWRLWPRIHWYPGAQTKLLAWASKLSPALLNRWTMKLVAGY